LGDADCEDGRHCNHRREANANDKRFVAGKPENGGWERRS
jgi:hypothetical protein